LWLLLPELFGALDLAQERLQMLLIFLPAMVPLLPLWTGIFSTLPLVNPLQFPDT
jgi:hypothetical protein